MATTITRLPNNSHVQVDFDDQIGYQVDVRSSVYYNEASGRNKLYIYDAYTVLPSSGRTFLDLTITDIVGRPSDDPKEVAEWLVNTFFFDNTQQQIDDLEATTFKITYFEIVDISVSTSGTITPPTGATIQTDQFGNSGNAVLSTLTGANAPTFESPEDGGGTAITVSLNPNTGDYISSDVFASPVALIYSFSISLGDIPNVDLSRAVDFYQVSAGATLHSELTLDDGTNPHGTTQSDVGLGNADNTSDLDKPISNATQAALDLKYDASNPNGFETPAELDARDAANRNRANHSGTQTASTISDFDAEVSNNTDVAANTAARHTQGTDQALDTGGADEVTANDLRTHLDNTNIHFADAPNDGNNYVRNSNSWSLYRGLSLDYVDFSDSPVAVVANTRYIIDTSGGDVTMNVPDAVASNENEVVAFYKDTSDSNSVTVQTVGSQDVGGQASQIIVEPEKGFTIKSGGSTRNEWFVIQDSRQAAPYYDIPIAASVAFDGLNGTRQKVTATQDVVIEDTTNVVDGADIVVKIVQDSTGGRTVTFENGWRFENGILNISQEPGAVTIIRGIYDASTSTVDIHSQDEDTLPELHFGTFNQLSLWHKMDDAVGSTTVLDSGPLGLDGTAVNSPEFGVTGYFRRAVNFQGANQYIQNLNAGVTDPLGGSNSWAVHVRAAADAPIGVFRAVMSLSDPGAMNPDNSTVALYPYSSTGGLTLGTRVWYNGSFIINLNNGPAADGSFHSYFLVQRDDNTLELWIDGVLEVTADPSDSLDNGVDTFLISSFDGTEEFYDGQVDDVRLFTDSTDITATVIPLIQNVASF